ADLDSPIGKILHDRRQQSHAILVRQHRGGSIAYGGDRRIGGPEVDPDRETMVVRAVTLPRFSNAQQRHQASSSACASSMSKSSLSTYISCCTVRAAAQLSPSASNCAASCCSRSAVRRRTNSPSCCNPVALRAARASLKVSRQSICSSRNSCDIRAPPSSTSTPRRPNKCCALRRGLFKVR